MKKNYFLLVILICLNLVGFSQNDHCNNALPFCTGTTYNFPAGVNTGSAEAGPNYGCLLTQPNPAWYYMKVAQSGPINIHISTDPLQDVDFVCWGPFSSPTAPCSNALTAVCSTCPSNTSDSAFYPSGNLVDCSYSVSWQEDCHIPNAIADEYYIIMITNYSNMACNIIFEQTNSMALLHGTINNTILGVTQNFKTDENSSDLFIYPNPFNESAFIKFSNPEMKPFSVSIYDITGKEVRKYENIKTEQLVIEKSELTSGIYTIEAVGEKTYKGKLIIE